MTREITVVGESACAPLTQGLVAWVDTTSLPFIEGYNWCATRCGGHMYAVRSYRVNGRRLQCYMHRMLTSAPDGLIVDHIDGNGLNNRMSNLRIVSHKDNIRNSRLSKNSTSGAKGVSWHKDQKFWRAYIRVDGRQIHLGRFESFEAACEAYRDANARYFGTFGRVV